MWAPTLAETQTMHDPAGMIGIVAHTRHGVNRFGKPVSGPPVRIESRGPGAHFVNAGDLGQLLSREAARATGRPPFAEGLHSSSTQRTLPAGGCRAANPEFSGNLGLREPP